MSSKAPRKQKRLKQGKPRQTGNPSREGKPRSDRGRIAISTGQAARYCLVSADTIANWIAAGRLRAQRTAGGQYRILLSDLWCFMRAHDMRTDLLDEESGRGRSCWEFWLSFSADRGAPGDAPATCVECPVYLGRAEVCYEIRPLIPGGTLRAMSCAECEYFAEGTAGNSAQ